MRPPVSHGFTRLHQVNSDVGLRQTLGAIIGTLISALAFGITLVEPAIAVSPVDAYLRYGSTQHGYKHVLTVPEEPNVAAAKLAKFEAVLESSVDLTKPPDGRRQTFYWLLDEKGKEIKALDLQHVAPFSEGLAAAMDFNHSLTFGNGFINTDGEFVIPVEAAHSRKFSEGLAWFRTEDPILFGKRPQEGGYMDTHGRHVIASTEFFEGMPFSEGVAAVRESVTSNTGANNLPGSGGQSRKWGYIDKSGHWVIPARFDDAQSFCQNRAAVQIGKDWFFIDEHGKQVGQNYQTADSFVEGLSSVQTGDKWGYASIDGTIAIPCSFEDARAFSEGLAAVKSDGKYGFINNSGRLVIPAKFSAVDRFTDGLCPVRSDDGMWGFINRNGSFAIRPIYEDANSFSCGRALVEIDGKFGYIDHRGKYIVRPKYDAVCLSYSENRAVVCSTNWNSASMRSALMEMHVGKLQAHKDSVSPTGIYIPVNLDDALKELDLMLSAPAKQDMSIIKQKDMIVYHRGLGMWLRNNWGLWKNLRLAQSLRSAGLRHPEDMSGTILDAYWSKLHGQPADISGHVSLFNDYWDKMRPVIALNVSWPSTFANEAVTDSDGKAHILGEIIQKTPVTVLALLGEGDALSPKLLTALDQLQVNFKPSQVRVIPLTSKGEMSGALTMLGKIADGKLAGPDTLEVKSSSQIKGCGRYVSDPALVRKITELLKLYPLVMPQTLLIRDGDMIIKRFNGFRETTKSELEDSIKNCLDACRALN